MKVSIGIIGYGEFGKFVYDLLERSYPNFANLKVYSRTHKINNKKFFNLDTICGSDFVIPCVPISAFENLIKKICPLLKSNSVLIELNSVKVMPVNILNRYKDKLKFVATHPMFGPNSFSNGKYDLSGKKLVITDSNIDKKMYQNLISLLQGQKLEIIECTAHEHDELASKTQFITHLIANLLIKSQAKHTKIDTNSYKELVDLADKLKSNRQLFEEMYMYNPYCKIELNKFTNTLNHISNNLHSKL